MDLIKARGISLFIIAFLNLVLALFILIKSKGDKTKFWLAITALSSGLFAFVCGGSFFFWAEQSVTFLFWWKATWLGVLLIPPLNIFTFYLVGNIKHIKVKASLLYLVAIGIGFTAITTNFFVSEYSDPTDVFSGGTGSLDSFGRIYILFGLVLALFNIFKKYIRSDRNEKNKFKYLVFSTAICLIGGIITSIIPIIIGKSLYFDIPAFLSFLWVVLITYSIFRYSIFNLRVLTSELLVLCTWIILFTRIIFSENYYDLLVNTILSLILTVLGFLFLKSINKEIKLDKQLLIETQKSLELERVIRQEFLNESNEVIRKMERIISGKI